jgi:hypothetical protein
MCPQHGKDINDGHANIVFSLIGMAENLVRSILPVMGHSLVKDHMIDLL